MSLLRDRTTWLHGDFFNCLQPPQRVERSWRLVLLGPPGVGKRTQAEFLAGTLGACLLSTADVFRAAHEHSVAPGSEMAEAQLRMKRGQFVPDDVVLDLVRNRRRCLRCAGGFLLDGFPRTMTQATMLDALLTAERMKLDAVLSYELPFRDVVARLSGRRVCRKCRSPYHMISRPPRCEGVCDRCGGQLIQRPDDEPAAIAKRLTLYGEATTQVKEYYRRQGLVISVDAAASPESVFAQTLERLAALEIQSIRPRGEAKAADVPAATLAPK